MGIFIICHRNSELLWNVRQSTQAACVRLKGTTTKYACSDFIFRVLRFAVLIHSVSERTLIKSANHWNCSAVFFFKKNGISIQWFRMHIFCAHTIICVCTFFVWIMHMQCKFKCTERWYWTYLLEILLSVVSTTLDDSACSFALLNGCHSKANRLENSLSAMKYDLNPLTVPVISLTSDFPSIRRLHTHFIRIFSPFFMIYLNETSIKYSVCFDFTWAKMRIKVANATTKIAAPLE